MAKTSIKPSGGRSPRAADAALSLAREAHAGQRRKQSGEPFVQHPIEVASLLAEAGYEGTEIAAAHLHDAVEKTALELSEVRERFGEEVARLVAALTEDPGLDGYAERKRALRRQVLESGRVATVIYAADRLANLRDWTALPAERRGAVAASLGTSLDERVRLWGEDLAELSAYDPELPFLDAVELELRRLQLEGERE